MTRQKQTERWLEVIAASTLGVVAVATAWSGCNGEMPLRLGVRSEL
jgi:hypothetical protein